MEGHRCGHSSSSPVPGAPAIPAPWDNINQAAYLASTSERLRNTFRKLREELDARVEAAGPANATSLFLRLRADGLKANPLGLDLTEVGRHRCAPIVGTAAADDETHADTADAAADDGDARAHAAAHPTDDSCLLADSEVLAALNILGMRGTSLERALFRLDQPHMRSPCTAQRSERGPAGQMLRRLRRNGYLEITTTWARSGFALNTSALQEQAEANLAAAGRKAAGQGLLARGRPLSSFERLPALEPLLNDPLLQRVITGYFGGPARYDGFNLIRYPPHFVGSFPACEWHHDRCGRRLKVFLYVDDVSASRHPTQIAAGSHTTRYYTHGEPWTLLSRFSDAYVRSRHRVASLTGRAGGGFVFDTNALHKGLRVGNGTRTVVILEFHPHGKVGPLLKFNNPCPSRRRESRSFPRSSWLNGEGGYPLYPREGLV